MNIYIMMLAVAAGAASDKIGPVNYTVLLSVISVCLTAMAVLIKVFGKAAPPASSADKPSAENSFCNQKMRDLNRIEQWVESNDGDISELREIINGLKITITEIQKDQESSNKTIADMKQDNRDLALKLEGLLSQLITYVGD